MRTQVMLERAAGMPWLELLPPGGGPPEQTPLPSFPFTLGRHESADLPLPSQRVSREHAVIACDEGEYRIRDLGSTNGTFVNGQRVDESALSDGDLLLLADVELTFFTGRADTTDRVVTQVMDLRSLRAGPDQAAAMLHELRQLQETSLVGGPAPRFATIVHWETDRPFGVQLSGPADDAPAIDPEARRRVLETEGRAVVRLRRLSRLAAVHEARRLAGDLPLFLRLEAGEIGAAELADSLVEIGRRLAPRPLVVEAPDSAVSDTPYFRALRERLAAAGIEMAHADFAGGATQLSQREAIAPQYLLAAPSLVRGLDRNRDRLRLFRTLVESAAAMACQVIAPDLRRAEEKAACREAGCTLGIVNA